jgi:protein required for attachment to host cells
MDRLVLVAPPQVLGDLRQALGAHGKGKLAGEINKDLTNLEAAELVIQLDEWINR